MIEAIVNGGLWDHVNTTEECVNFLVEERHWDCEGKSKSSDQDDDTDGKEIIAPEFGFEGTKDDLIAKIQEEGDEIELQRLTAEVSNDIITKAAPPRKPRHS